MKYLLLTALLILNGCATNLNPTLTHGSRVDGLITLSLEHAPHQIPVIDWVIAGNQADSHCQDWGYVGAKRVTDEIKSCANNAIDGCRRWRMEYKYLCLSE